MKKCLLTLMLAVAPFAALGETYDDLVHGAQLGDVATIRPLLARGASVDTSDGEGNTLLMLAARDGHEALVKLLIDYRAKLNARNAAGDTALALAALRGQRKIVEILVGAGASQTVPGWPPLVYAAFGGHSEIVTYLLENGADIDASSEGGMTALMAAARNGHLAVARSLMAAGADVARRTDRGDNALDIAQRTGNTEIVELLRTGRKSK